MSEFVEYLAEVFEHFGPIHAKRMFGGYGIYRDELMFGLVADDILYLKADAASSQHFETRRLNAFEYAKNGKKMKMSYFLAPEDIFDDKDDAKIWANRAYAAALRSKKLKKRITKRPEGRSSLDAVIRRC